MVSFVSIIFCSMLPLWFVQYAVNLGHRIVEEINVGMDVINDDC